MRCPKCKEKTAVIDGTHAPNNEDYRKRKCLSCGHIFYTIEFEAEATRKFLEDYWKYNRKKETTNEK